MGHNLRARGGRQAAPRDGVPAMSLDAKVTSFRHLTRQLYLVTITSTLLLPVALCQGPYSS